MVHLCNCFQFVAFLVTFNDLCCGLLSHAFVDNGQSWQTGPNEFVLHFEAVFVVCWHQIVELIQVVSCTISLFWSNYANFCHRFVFWRYWNKSSNQKKYHVCVYTIIWSDCHQKFASMLHLRVCLVLFHFVLTINAAEHNVVAYSHAYVYG